MSGARQRKRKSLRVKLMHALSTQIGNFHSLPARDVAQAVTLMVDAENLVRCMRELRKDGRLGMYALADQYKEIVGRSADNASAPVVLFAATRSLQDLNGIATLFTAQLVDAK